MELTRTLADWWSKIWPNLAASALWVPITMLHISRSNRKTLKFYVGDKPGPDDEGVTHD
jgi:hypothetical protein